MIRRFFSRLRNRDGQALILAAIVFPVVLLFLAVVVDTAHAFVDQKHLQNTADAASLAAAQQLNGGVQGCTSIAACATQYVAVNNGPSGMVECADAGGSPIHAYISSDPSATPNCYQSPYYDKTGNPQNDQVVVWLYECNPTFFGGILGISHVCASVHSVSQANQTPLLGQNIIPGTPASSTPGSTQYSVSTQTVTTGGSNGALFATDTSCAGGITITGNKQFVFSAGSAYSDGGFKNSIAYNFTNGSTGSYNQKCTKPLGNFSGGLTTNNGTTPFPVTWDTSLTGSICSQSTHPIDPNPAHTTTIPKGAAGNGIWCAAGEIDNNNNNGGAQQLTIIASKVKLAGSVAMSPFTQNLLAAATGTAIPAITLSTNNNNASGGIYAPNSTVNISGNQLQIGFVEALDIIITTNQFTLIGNGPLVGATTSTNTISTPTNTITGTVTPSTPDSTQTITTGTSTNLLLKQ